MKKFGKALLALLVLLLLAAEEAHFINGAIITADDGMTG